eukprot:234204-Prymnesium_polylepis.2
MLHGNGGTPGGGRIKADATLREVASLGQEQASYALYQALEHAHGFENGRNASGRGRAAGAQQRGAPAERIGRLLQRGRAVRVP